MDGAGGSLESQDTYSLYHTAPIYQVRRDMEKLARQLDRRLARFLKSGMSEAWSEQGVAFETVSEFQLFRRTYSSNAKSGPAFRWMNFEVRSFSQQRATNIREYFNGEAGESVLGQLQRYFGSDPEVQSLLSDLVRNLQHADHDQGRQRIHDNLLRIYSSIETRGFLMSGLWNLWEAEANDPPAAYLVHVKPRDKEDDGTDVTTRLPDFVHWIASVNELGGADAKKKPAGETWAARDSWSKQQPVEVVARPGNEAANSDDRRALAKFFEERLFPLFQYDRYEFDRPYDVAQGNVEAQQIGFVFVPVYSFNVPLPPQYVHVPAGDWLGVLQIKLFINGDKKIPDSNDPIWLKPSFCHRTFIDLVADIASHVEPMVEKMAESVALTKAGTNVNADYEFVEGLKASLGWNATLVRRGDENQDDGEPIRHMENCKVRVRMNWNPDGDGRDFYRTFDVEVPEAASIRNLTETDDASFPEPLLPTVFETCNRVYRSVYMLHRALEAQNNALPASVNDLIEKSESWFRATEAKPGSPAHDADYSTRRAREMFQKTVKGALAFVPGSWFVDEPATIALHTSLKSLVGANGICHPTIGFNGPLNLGGLYILFLTVVAEQDPKKAENLAKRLPLQKLPELYTSVLNAVTRDDVKNRWTLGALCAVFLNAIKNEGKGHEKTCVARASPVERNGETRAVVTLSWDDQQRKKLFRKLEDHREDLAAKTPGGSLIRALMAMSSHAAVASGKIRIGNLIQLQEGDDGLKMTLGPWDDRDE